MSDIFRGVFHALILSVALAGCFAKKPEPPDVCPQCGNPFIHGVVVMGPNQGQSRCECHRCGRGWEHNPPKQGWTAGDRQ